MEQLSAKVELRINQAIDQDKLVLPTLPEIALRVREIADDENASIKQLTDTISTDAALTTRIIKVANSPILRAPKEIESLQMALSRLGMKYTCNLATGLAMEQMFQATSDLVDKKLRQVWSQSSEIAGICYVLCKQFTNLSPDQAALAGLVHKIGALPILSFAEDHKALLRDSITLEKIIRDIHSSLGVKILSDWDFPTELRNVPKDYLDFERTIPSADYADIVTVAMLQSNASSGITNDELDLSKIRAFERLGLDPHIDSAEAEDLSEEMEAAMAMLQ